MEPLPSQGVQMPTNIAPILLDSTIAISILLAGAVAVLILSRDNSKVPHANPAPWYSPVALMQVNAMKRGLEIFYDAKKRFPEGIFRMINTYGETTVFPSNYANAIRNEEGLSFAKTVMNDFQGNISGFKPLGLIDHRGQVLQNLARKPLTKLLNTVTQPLASEAIYSCDVILGNSTEWKDTLILDSMLDLIARLSSRVFLGDRLCRDENWLKITKEYTVDVFRAAQMMTLVPVGIRYILPFIYPECKIVRTKMLRARALVKTIVDERRAIKEKARRAGEPIPTFNDAIEWGEVESKGVSYDPSQLQLVLSLAAIHTTSDLLSKIMLLLATEPALIEPLREEMIRVLKKEGWNKNALYNMKLVDSAMKEAQRVMPSDRLAMNRIATSDVHLKEQNVTIRKGQRIAIDASRVNDPTLFENPEKFDIYRWVRLRETPEYASKAHFVSTSPEHLAFGHGMHACPGRFFAANEVKIALCFLLLNYDWELAPGTTPKQLSFGTSHIVPPESTLRYKRREAEVDLEALKFE